MQTATEVPVWVNGLQRWVTGVDRRTTCDDVIKVLLRSDPQSHHPPGWVPQHQQPHQPVPHEELHHRYAIVERWRKVERPLDGRSRILKVWNAWGDAQRDVKLALRRRVPGTNAPASGGSTNATDLSALNKESSRRRRHHHHLVGRECSAKTIHPRRLYSRACREDGEEPWEGVAEEDEEEPRPSGEQRKFTETMEKLMKLILAQGETIQAQLKKLREREDQIDHFEHEVHRLRVKNHGSNYLLDTYLKGVDAEIGLGEEKEEGGEDSGVVTEGGSGDGGDPAPPSGEPKEDERRLEDLQPHIEAWEKILKVNKKLERTEECLVKLQAKLWEATQRREEEEALEWTKAEVERAALQAEDGDAELRRNEQALANADEWLRVRQRVLDGLELELEAAERESEALRKAESGRLAEVTPYEVVPRRVTFLAQNGMDCCDKVARTKADPHDTDSNSDTGLSSLHSSSEEGGYVLDTLV